MTRLALWVLRVYKRVVSPLLPPSCRFSPTCSEYARLAILQNGLLRGAALAGARIARCQPFARQGIDLPPFPRTSSARASRATGAEV